jgi:glycolate oxidase
MPEQPAGTSTMHEVIDAARAKLDDDLWNYIAGGAETETTLRRNRLALDSLALRPRVLRDVSAIDPGTTLLGRRLRIPVILAPLGGAEALSADGSLSSARAAERFGVTAMISSISEPSLEAVGAASGGAKIAQIYVRGDDAWLEATSASVLAAGYDANASCAAVGDRRRTARVGSRGSSGSRG